MQKKKPYILGCDPGIKGAMALLCVQKGVLKAVWDIPVQPTGIKSRNGIDVGALSIRLGAYADEIEFAVIEDVHSRPHDGAVGAFAFGKSTGILIGVIGGFLIPQFFTPPEVWKNVMGLSKDKAKSRALAATKYPAFSESFKRAKDDGRAEAALLAEFGKRFY